MSAAHGLDRRRFLGTVASLALASAVAGCADDTDGETPRATTRAATTTAATDDSTERTESTATTQSPADTDAAGDDLDLREANVVDVAVEPVDGGYRFDVTLHHDDDGEDGYADWWQVETIRGERMGRRALAHPHSTQPFTRSTTIDVPSGLSCVVVRGHDQIHGYGGRAMILNLESGATHVVDQGPDAQQFAASDCP